MVDKKKKSKHADLTEEERADMENLKKQVEEKEVPQSDGLAGAKRSSNQLLIDQPGTDRAPEKEQHRSGIQPEDTMQTVVMQTTIKELFSREELHKKTDLNSRQLRVLPRAAIFAEQYQSAVMKRYIEVVMEMNISKERKGRQEMVSIIGQSATGMIEDERGSGDVLARLLSK